MAGLQLVFFFEDSLFLEHVEHQENSIYITYYYTCTCTTQGTKFFPFWVQPYFEHLRCFGRMFAIKQVVKTLAIYQYIHVLVWTWWIVHMLSIHVYHRTSQFISFRLSQFIFRLSQFISLRLRQFLFRLSQFFIFRLNQFIIFRLYQFMFVAGTCAVVRSYWLQSWLCAHALKMHH